MIEFSSFNPLYNHSVPKTMCSFIFLLVLECYVISFVNYIFLFTQQQHGHFWSWGVLYEVVLNIYFYLIIIRMTTRSSRMFYMYFYFYLINIKLADYIFLFSYQQHWDSTGIWMRISQHGYFLNHIYPTYTLTRQYFLINRLQSYVILKLIYMQLFESFCTSFEKFTIRTLA